MSAPARDRPPGSPHSAGGWRGSRCLVWMLATWIWTSTLEALAYDICFLLVPAGPTLGTPSLAPANALETTRVSPALPACRDRAHLTPAGADLHGTIGALGAWAGRAARRGGRGAAASGGGRPFHVALVRPAEPEPLVQLVAVARVEHPAEIRVRPLLHREPPQLDAEAPAPGLRA